MSIRALEPLATSNPAVQTVLQNRLKDPIRLVRLDAAWALRARLAEDSLAAADLQHYLAFNADQPAGALQLGVFQLDRNNLPKALDYFERAVTWDTNSAPSHNAFAVALSAGGQKQRAVQELQAACKLAPREAEYQFKLGLAFNEIGNLEGARSALETAVKLDPTFSQAWYNLGLACSALGRPEEALDKLTRAESIDATSPQIPYARATVLARLGRSEEARRAAARALEIQPAYSDAAELLRSLSAR
jgi:Flp pilus assembly protein TadD